MNRLIVTSALVILASTYSERSIAQSVRMNTAKTPTIVAAGHSLSPGEVVVKTEADQKKIDIEFNSRRLLRFHQLWNLYLFRNEEAARSLKSEVDSMIAEDTQPAIDEELARAEAEGREPRELQVALRPETSNAKSKLKSKNEFNETARAESNTTRLTKVHAGLEPEEVSLYIEADAKFLAKRLRAEIAAGGENGEKAKVNLAYLQGTLLPKLRDPRYFSVSRTDFATEFNKVIGSSTSR